MENIIDYFWVIVHTKLFYQILLIILIVIIIVCIMFVRIKELEDKIETAERIIQKNLRLRSDLIPSIFEISKDQILKHNEVFEEIIKLRKVQFLLNQYDTSLIEFIKNEVAINHEIRFIYKICNTNKRLARSKKFIYIKNQIIAKNKTIGKHIELYKKYINRYNWWLGVKNYTFFGLLIRKEQKLEINVVKNIF